MNVLIIGSGAREHVLSQKISESEQCSKIFAAPGNPGISEFAELADIELDDLEGLLNFAKQNKIDFTIVGPELPLTLGICDLFRAHGQTIFGPTAAAARLEGSKSYAKGLMKAAGIATAEHQVFTELPALLEDIAVNAAPLVLKADGLAAGKGVFVCMTDAEAEQAARKLFQNFAASQVVREDFMAGVEASYIVATDGLSEIVLLPASHDYKRIGEQDSGLNTGGMGTVCPTPRLSEQQHHEVVEQVIKPLLAEMKQDDQPFCGFVYAGLMILPDGQIKVVEFNARLGDPETQVILQDLDFDLLTTLHRLAEAAQVSDVQIQEASDEFTVSGKSYRSGRADVCVVLAAEGYPGVVTKGDEISGLDLARQKPDIQVYHAGTMFDGNTLLTDGGRVLSVVGSGEDIEAARSNAYSACDLIQFRGIQLRRDIAVPDTEPKE